jgi:hypothetical protein
MSYDDFEYDDDYEYDDDADFDDDAEFDDDAAPRPRPRPAPRPAQSRPAPRPVQSRPYGQMMRGRNAGVITTPNGQATVQLPAKFPTVGELKGTLQEIQADIKRNSDGIRALGRTNVEQDGKLASLNRTFRRSAKFTFWTSILLGTFTIGPRLLSAINRPAGP